MVTPREVNQSDTMLVTVVVEPARFAVVELAIIFSIVCISFSSVETLVARAFAVFDSR